MKYFALVIPILLIALVIYSAIKKIKPYDAFAEGVGKTLPLIKSIFPYLATILIMTELFEKSGLTNLLSDFLSPALSFLGIEKELVPLILIKPFSGSGSIAILSGIYSKYGADGYLSRCASVIFGSSETIFYISAVYFAGVKEKRLIKPIIISLVSTFISIIFACAICRVM